MRRTREVLDRTDRRTVAPPGTGGRSTGVRPRPVGVADRIAARLVSGTLDARLAAGVPSSSGRLLRARAAQLHRPRHRAALAEGWDRVASAATGRRPPRTGQVRPVADLTGALAAIDQLVASVRDPTTPTAVLAAASHLLTDGTGPTYNRRSPVDLGAELRALVAGAGRRPQAARTPSS